MRTLSQDAIDVLSEDRTQPRIFARVDLTTTLHICSYGAVERDGQHYSHGRFVRCSLAEGWHRGTLEITDADLVNTPAARDGSLAGNRVVISVDSKDVRLGYADDYADEYYSQAREVELITLFDGVIDYFNAIGDTLIIAVARATSSRFCPPHKITSEWIPNLIAPDTVVAFDGLEIEFVGVARG